MDVLNHDKVNEEVSVMTVFDPIVGRWETTIIGGPSSGYTTSCRVEENYMAQHARAIKSAKEAIEYAANSDARSAAVGTGDQPAVEAPVPASGDHDHANPDAVTDGASATVGTTDTTTV